MTTRGREREREREREGGESGIIHIPNTGNISARGQCEQMHQQIHDAQSRFCHEYRTCTFQRIFIHGLRNYVFETQPRPKSHYIDMYTCVCFVYLEGFVWHRERRGQGAVLCCACGWGNIQWVISFNAAAAAASEFHIHICRMSLRKFRKGGKDAKRERKKGRKAFSSFVKKEEGKFHLRSSSFLSLLETQS